MHKTTTAFKLGKKYGILNFVVFLYCHSLYNGIVKSNVHNPQRIQNIVRAILSFQALS